MSNVLGWITITQRQPDGTIVTASYSFTLPPRVKKGRGQRRNRRNRR